MLDSETINYITFQSIDKILPMFKALSSKIRLDIIMLLAQRSLFSKDLQNNFGINLSTLKHHLNILQNLDLISSNTNKKGIIYAFNKDQIGFYQFVFFDYFLLKQKENIFIY